MKKRFNDSLRKRIVYLKRNTYIIPLIFILLSCLVFNLNLTCISDTTAIIYANGMGFTMFVISLFSYLSLITYMQAFPKRKKKLRKIRRKRNEKNHLHHFCADILRLHSHNPRVMWLRARMERSNLHNTQNLLAVQ